MQTWSFAEGRWCEGDHEGAEYRWFRIDSPDAEALEALRARFGLHPLAIEDCLSPNFHASKIDEFSDHLFAVFIAPSPMPDGEIEEFDAFLGRDWVITYSDVALPEVERVTEAIREGIHLRPGPDGLLYEIVDRMVDGFLPMTMVMSERLDVIEDAIIERPNDAHSRNIVEMRAAAGRLRRHMIPQLTTMMRLSRGEFPYVRETNLIYYRDIYDHLVRVDLSLENVREDAEMALSTHLAALNNRMSEIMKVLSAVAALALPATVISGIFGTNFDNVPGLHSNWGFGLMMAGMIGIMVMMAAYFKRRGWW